LTKPAPKNLPASVRQQLANLARERNVDFGLILVKYGVERRGLWPDFPRATRDP
jgi:hypothetical protein